MRLALLLLVVAACPGSDKPAPETGDTAETGDSRNCPSSMEELCELDFGGPCPSFDIAAATMCDGPHFSATGTESPSVDADGDATCPNPHVSCRWDDDDYGDDYHTTLWFRADGSGELQGVSLSWPDTDECPGRRYFGELEC